MKVMNAQTECKVGQTVEAIRSFRMDSTSAKVTKGEKGIITHIPSWRDDSVQVQFETAGYVYAALSCLKKLIEIVQNNG